MFMVICLTFSRIAEPTVVFNNGQVNLVDYTINDIVDIQNSPSGTPTTVNLVGGGNILGYRCHINDKSVMNISNGSVQGYVLALDNTRFNMTSGNIKDSLLGDGYSHLNVSGGFIASSGEGNLQVSNHSEVIFRGGQVGDYSNLSANDFRVGDFAKGTIMGGTIERLLALDEGQVNIKGGQIGYSSYLISMLLYEDSKTTMSGGKIFGPVYLGANPFWIENCMLTVEGDNFKINGLPVDYGNYFNTNPTYTDYYLTGTLRSGEQINNTIRLYDNTVLYLVPEPATLLLLGLGVPILAGLRRKR